MTVEFFMLNLKSGKNSHLEPMAIAEIYNHRDYHDDHTRYNTEKPIVPPGILTGNMHIDTKKSSYQG